MPENPSRAPFDAANSGSCAPARPRAAARRAAAFAALGLLAGASGGCRPAATARPVEIRYWTGWTGHELAAQRRLVDEFTRTHPGIRVHISSVAGSYNKLRIAFAGGATPDVASAVWADELAAYAMRGVLRPLDDLMRRSGRSGAEFVPGVWRMVHYRGRPYALALTTNAGFIVYNKDRFREVGLDPERPPRTIDELDRANERLLERAPDGSIRRYGMRPVDLNRWACAFGGSWYDPETGEITANDPRNVAALRWMASYARRYGAQAMRNFESTFGGMGTPNGPFFVGKAAMWQTGEYALEHLRRYAPRLRWGWFPYPAPPGGRPNSTTLGGSVFVIPAASRHPEEAWTFLDWLTRRPATAAFCAAITNLPARRDLAAAPRFRREPLFAFALDLVSGPNAVGPPPLPIWQRFKAEIQRAEEYAVLGGQDPQQLLDELDARMERELVRLSREAE